MAETFEAEKLCKEFKGKISDNFCIIENKNETTISIWNPFTRDKPEMHMNKEDFKNILDLSGKQAQDNWHFFTKQEINKTTFYKTQAYKGSFLKKGEYFGWQFLVNKEGKIIEQK